MKTYKKVEVEAANAPSGSYAAGCPSKDTGSGHEFMVCVRPRDYCKQCDRAH